MIIKPILFRYLTQPLDIKTKFLILTIFISNEWSNTLIHRIKLIHQIPKPPFRIYIHLILTVLFPHKIYDKRDDFDFDILNFLFLDGDVPRRPPYEVYISQL